MGKKKKSVSQVIVQSDNSDDLKPETDTILEETEKTTTAEILMPVENALTPTEDNTSPIQTVEKEEKNQLTEDAPILSKTDDVVAEPKAENDKKEQENESKTVETTTSENSVELKEIQIKPNEDEPITKTNCSKGWCMIL